MGRFDTRFHFKKVQWHGDAVESLGLGNEKASAIDM
jgi:hypothetical protein